MKKPTLSIAIVAHNEERNIEACLKSASWADEMIVIDAGSTDKTAVMAAKLGAKVFPAENQPLMKINMNLAFEKCTGEWIFSLDADERISPELKGEIIRVVNSDTSYSAFQAPRKNIIFGEWIAHTGWYPDYQIRLFRRGKGKFPAKNVHELLTVDGSVGNLEHDIEHLHYRTVSEFLGKLDSYTTVEAQKLIREGKKATWTDAITFPKDEFLSRFFARRGYKDGLHGLVLSLLMAFYWEVVFAKIWESRGFTKFNPPDFLKMVRTAGSETLQEFYHWVSLSLTAPAERLVYKFKKNARRWIE